MKNTSDIVKEVSKSGAGGATQEQIKAILTKTFQVIGQQLNAGEEVKFADFGTFSVNDRPARQGRNPATGETIQIAASKAVKFKALKGLKDAL